VAGSNNFEKKGETILYQHRQIGKHFRRLQPPSRPRSDPYGASPARVEREFFIDEFPAGMGLLQKLALRGGITHERDPWENC